MKKSKTNRPKGKAAKKERVPKASTRALRERGAPLKWTFYAVNRLSEDVGLNDAGVETFKGNIIENLARESLQNSLDAADPSEQGPVRVEFKLLSLQPEVLPDISALRESFSQCGNYWDTDEEVQNFMSEALRISSETIPALRISDFHTTGAEGSDIDRSSNWYKLTRSCGASSKHEGEGGSYGIGARAQFAASRLRTVLYATKTGNGGQSFIGVARLVTHDRKTDGEKADSVGYLGEPAGDHAGGSISQANRIPKVFRREPNGTDVFILGFPDDDSWEKELVLSVLENFWPAILFGDLEVTVGSQIIKKSNLKSLLQQCSAEEGFAAHLYHAAYVAPTHDFEANEGDLPILKHALLKLRVGEAGLPKKVAMIRRTGMVIYRQRFHSPAPFCGVFLCRNEDGNGRLREMEPPRHNEWNPNLPAKGANANTEREFRGYIRERIKEMTVKDDSNVLEVTEIAQLLPDDEPVTPSSDGGKAAKDGSPAEAFPGADDAVAQPKEFPVDIMKAASVATSGSNQGEDGGGDEKGESDRSSNGENSDGENNPSDSGGNDALPVSFRAFSKGGDASTYSITVRFADKPPTRCHLKLRSVGDDAKRVLRINGAKQLNGRTLQVAADNRIGPIKCPKTVPLKLEVTVDEPRRIAMEVAAYEA